MAAARSRIQREKDLAELAERYLAGNTQAAIAEDLGVSQQQISLDLKTLSLRWQETASLKIDAAKARDLARIDRLEREYWAAWDASKTEKVTTTTERLSDGEDKPERARARVTRVKSVGNPQFLAGVQWCIDRRIRLLGLDAPAQVDIEVRIREEASRNGIDPEEAVRAAAEVIRQHRGRVG